MIRVNIHFVSKADIGRGYQNLGNFSPPMSLVISEMTAANGV